MASTSMSAVPTGSPAPLRPAERAAMLRALDIAALGPMTGPNPRVGAVLVTAFIRAGLVDEVHTYLAPALLGAGPCAVGDLGIGTMADALRLTLAEVHRLGPDVLLVTRTEHVTKTVEV